MGLLAELFRIVLIALLFTFLLGPGSPAGAESFSAINLVTDDPMGHPAQLTDPALQNAWGVSHSSGSPFWVSSNGMGVAILYSVNPNTNFTTKVQLGMPPMDVKIPGDGTVTGQAFNSAGAGTFNGNAFLFVSEDGTISGWRGALGTTAEVLQTGSSANVYKGTTLVTNGANSYLLSANFRAGTIDVLKGNAGAPDLAGKFTDPNLPSGFAPFNIQVLGGIVYVAYAKQDATGHDDDPGQGNGFVSAFRTDGTFLGRIGTTGTLNSPWGLAIAPGSFGQFAGDLLVGNFGDGFINVFSPDPAAPGFLGQLSGANGSPLFIDGLWALIPGNDGNGGNSQSIYFSAGPDGETHGLFGVLQVPEPSTALLLLSGITGLLVLRRRNEA
jgi:uncharacterized protein (TIGR03118 family)